MSIEVEKRTCKNKLCKTGLSPQKRIGSSKYNVTCGSKQCIVDLTNIYTVNCWINKGYTEKQAKKIISEQQRKNNEKLIQYKKENPKKYENSYPTKTCYWVNKGYSEEEAKEKVFERQVTFSKKKCIDTYGKAIGTTRWENRQKKWLKTLDSKTKLEKIRINSRKSPHTQKLHKYSISKAENELAEILECEQQFIIDPVDCAYRYDLRKDNKIIEYNGDFWHSNPKIYDKDYLNKVTGLIAKDKWKLDKDKIYLARYHGYHVLVIWEMDYKKNKEKVIKQCRKFLES